jgi:hypothetical protein
MECAGAQAELEAAAAEDVDGGRLLGEHWLRNGWDLIHSSR